MKKSDQTGKFAAIAALFLSLAGCGGGGSGDGSSSSAPPAAAPPSAPVLGTAPTPSYTDSVRTSAFETINAERLKAGLGALKQSTELDTSASDHSNYLLLNPTSTPNYGEDAGNAGYTDDDPDARMADALFIGSAENEVLTASTSVGSEAALTLLAGPYHRAFTMDQRWTQMGFGFVPNTDGVGTLVGDLGLPQGGTAQGMTGSASLYPVANATDVPVMMADEQPMYALAPPWGTGPLPGYPVSVQLPFGDTWTPGTFTLVETSSGASVAGTVLDNSSLALYGNGLNDWAFFIPNAPLKPATSYTATFTATVQANAFSKTWAFTTRAGSVTILNAPPAAASAATGATVNLKSASLVQTVSDVTLSSQCGSAEAQTVVSPGAVKVKLSGGTVTSGCLATVTVGDLAYPAETANFTVTFVP